MISLKFTKFTNLKGINNILGNLGRNQAALMRQHERSDPLLDYEVEIKFIKLPTPVLTIVDNVINYYL